MLQSKQQMVTHLYPGMLVIVLRPVEPHTPDHLESVQDQHLDEGKLVKIQQVN